MRLFTRLLPFVCALACSPLHADDMPTYTLGGLVYHSPVILVAYPILEPLIMLRTPTASFEMRRYVVQERLRSNRPMLPDTLLVEVSSYAIGGSDKDTVVLYGTYDPPYYEHDPPVFQPFLSGIRPFRGDTALLPVQPMNPGSYHFWVHKGMTLSQWISDTWKTIRRFDDLLALRTIQPMKAQNEALFAWIQQNRHCWMPDSSLYFEAYNDCDWDDAHWDVFMWINGNGLWQDAWKSILLSHEVLPSMGYIATQPEDTPRAFDNPEARAFLMEQIASQRNQNIAIQQLSQAIWHWQEPPSNTTREEKDKALDLVLPLLYQEDTKYSALYFAQAALQFDRALWPDKATAPPLLALKKAYSETTDAFFKERIQGVLR